MTVCFHSMRFALTVALRDVNVVVRSLLIGLDAEGQCAFIENHGVT